MQHNLLLPQSKSLVCPQAPSLHVVMGTEALTTDGGGGATIIHMDGHRSFSPTTHQSTWDFMRAFKVKFHSHEHPLAKLRMIIEVKDISKY